MYLSFMLAYGRFILLSTGKPEKIKKERYS